jgi:hypothetical protein
VVAAAVGRGQRQGTGHAEGQAVRPTTAPDPPI